MTIALYVTEEMCARMGVITGKGLSDLIRGGIRISLGRFFCDGDRVSGRSGKRG